MNLRKLWGQGTDLHFALAHRGDTIEFLADDPAVKDRRARMSKRSDGVTQFFRTSIVLHARRRKHKANSYVYLFDEPGVYLHPQGQKDLLQVFEQLGAQNQIVYATHSLFMLNQNFPERHRLVFKDSDGTKIDQKGHRANWRLATDALGVFLTSNILFASHLLLVEGDSDPLYLYELFRQLNGLNEIDVDVNRLGILAFSDVSNLRFLLQVIKRESDTPIRAMVLVDGDEAGNTLVTRSKALLDRLSVKVHRLEPNKSIEDYCLYEPLFLKAVAKTIDEARDGDAIPDLEKSLSDSWAKRRESLQPPGKATAASQTQPTDAAGPITAGLWFKRQAKEVLGYEASKVALARSYVLACRESKDPPGNAVSARALCATIANELGIPGRASE